MSPDITHARAMIEAWREQRADRLDPMRFRFLDALERRTALHQGEARRILDQRLSALLERYEEDLAANTGGIAEARHGLSPPGPLSELLDLLARHAATRSEDGSTGDADASGREEMAVLGDFQKLWSEVRSESQLRQSLAFVPANAGPLNSAALVQRSLALMHALSPGYLQHFLAYVDDLSWLEQLGECAAGKASTRSSTPRKRSRKKPTS